MSTVTTPTSTRSVGELTWIRLMRVYQQIDRHTAEIMKKHELSVPRFDVLVHAGAREGRSQQELADAMFVTKGNICQLLDGMEAENLLYRRRKGRTNHIFLTDEGQDRRRRALDEQVAAINTAMGSLAPEEQETLHTLLRKLDRSLTKGDIWKGQ
jgi:DNA-binding MarR family transcriptional regulator